MILKEMMREHREVHTLSESSRIIEAVDMMRENRIGSVVIVDDSGSVSGIITDRDIAMVLAYGAAEPESYVTESMSREVQVVDESTTLFDATRVFRDSGVKRVPIVNKNGCPVGIVSVDDVMAFLSREMVDTCSSLEPKLGTMI